MTTTNPEFECKSYGELAQGIRFQGDREHRRLDNCFSYMCPTLFLVTVFLALVFAMSIFSGRSAHSRVCWVFCKRTSESWSRSPGASTTPEKKHVGELRAAMLSSFSLLVQPAKPSGGHLFSMVCAVAKEVVL
jgi:hypothetical protein